MADVSPLGVTDWGSLLNSFGQGQQQQALTGAEAQRTQQASIALQQQNQITQASMPLIMQAIAQEQQDESTDGTQSGGTGGQSGVNTPGGFPAGTDQTGLTGATSAADAADTSPNPRSSMDPGYLGRVDQGLRQQLAVNEAGTPQEQGALARAAMMSGLPGTAGQYGAGMLEKAKIQRQLNVEQRKQNSMLQSSNIFDKMRAVVDADDGNHLHTLDGVDAATAARIRAGEPDATKQEADAVAYAEHVAAEVHQYTGRKAIPQGDGIYVDETSGIQVPGLERVSMTVAERAAMVNDLLQPVPVADGGGGTIQVAKWKAPLQFGGMGASSLQSAMNQRLHMAGDPAGSPQTQNGGPATAQRDATTAAAAQARKGLPPGSAGANDHGIASQSDRSRIPAPPPGTFMGDVNAPRQLDKQGVPTAPLPSPLPTAKPTDVMPVALSDRYFHVHNTPGAPGGDWDNRKIQGTTPDLIQQGNIDNYKAKRAELQSWAQASAGGASQALMNFTAAKAILDGQYDGKSFTAIQGFPGEVMQKLAGITGVDSVTAQNRTIVAKYLTNAALSSFGGSYTTPPSVEALRVNTGQAFPNLDGSLGGARDLINSQIAQMQYVRDAAARVPGAMARGVDPAAFGSWHEHFFPRSGAVQAATSPAMVRMLNPDGKAFQVPAARQKVYESNGWKFAPKAAQ